MKNCKLILILRDFMPKIRSGANEPTCRKYGLLNKILGTWKSSANTNLT